MNKTCVKVLFLSRLTWIQEGLKWWRLHPETMATSDMDVIYIYIYSIAPKKVSDVLRH